jgi:hypothetical protein
MSASPCNNRRDFRRVQLPTFISPPEPLPPVAPRCRKPAKRSSVDSRRLTSIYAYLCALTVVAFSTGIAVGSVTRLPVPASVVEAK